MRRGRRRGDGQRWLNVGRVERKRRGNVFNVSIHIIPNVIPFTVILFSTKSIRECNLCREGKICGF